MTTDDIMKLAREAGFLIDGDSWIHAGAVLVDGRKSIDKQLKRFAALVAAHEREAIPQMFDPPPLVQRERQPLTLVQIRQWWASENGMEDCEMAKFDDFLRVIRAIEAAHNIKEKP
jgi:hypothetical protein